jgi:hypothetical protein
VALTERDPHRNRVLGPRIFTVRGTDPSHAHRDLLVFAPPPALAAVREDAVVRIIGAFVPLATTDVAVEWGWSGRQSIESNLDHHGVVVADAILVDGANVALGALRFTVTPDIAR